jgi:hypothetical protein
MNVNDRDRSQSSYNEDVFRVELGTDVRQYVKRKKEPACSFVCACGLRAPKVQTCSCIVRSARGNSVQNSFGIDL